MGTPLILERGGQIEISGICQRRNGMNDMYRMNSTAIISIEGQGSEAVSKPRMRYSTGTTYHVSLCFSG